MIFTNLIQTNLQTSFIGRHIEYFSFTDSTNDDAWKLIADNNEHNGMIVIMPRSNADIQRKETHSAGANTERHSDT